MSASRESGWHVLICHMRSCGLECSGPFGPLGHGAFAGVSRRRGSMYQFTNHSCSMTWSAPHG